MSSLNTPSACGMQREYNTYNQKEQHAMPDGEEIVKVCDYIQIQMTIIGMCLENISLTAHKTNATQTYRWRLILS